MSTEKKAKLPYQRYGKVPYRYSAEIYACQKACREGRTADYRRNHGLATIRARGGSDD